MIDSRYFYIVVLLLIMLRFFHFGNQIDQPHDWRQCDTAYYIDDFYENGVDLLYPAVCWMGASDTLALEFPLPEAIVASAWKITGKQIWIARLIFYLFFLGATYYLYRIIAFITDETLAKSSILLFIGSPLSLFYSRAIHIDFFVLLFAHAMVFFFLLAVKRRKFSLLLLSAIAATIGFVVKAPYVFYWCVPMLIYAICQKSLPWLLKNSWLYLIPVFFFYLWQQHVYQMNSQSPDLGYIRHYHKMVDNTGWYFGTLNQRLSLYPWWVLLKRGIFEVTGLFGLLFLLVGLYRWKRWNHIPFIWSWIIMVIIYVLVFFNLNFVHNYYQIPLLAPASLLSAYGVRLLFNRAKQLMALALILVLNIAYAEINYYKVDQKVENIAGIIKNNTPASALVITTYQNLDCRNPRILYRTGRRGWSVEELALNPNVINRLHEEEGADYWVYIGQKVPSVLAMVFGDKSRPEIFPIDETLDKVFIFSLR